MIVGANAVGVNHKLRGTGMDRFVSGMDKRDKILEGGRVDS